MIFALFASLSGCVTAGQGAIRVTTVKLNGVKAVKTAQLKSALATVQSSRLPWGTKHFFNREQFEADLKRIVAFYKDRGYPDARVRSFDVKLNDKQDAVAVTFNVDEGQPVLVEQIEFNGFDAIPAPHLSALQNQLPLKVHAPLDRALAQASRETALDEVKDHGYPYATVRLTDRAGSSDHSRILTLTATAGTVAHYGDVSIAGNKTLSDRIVRRQLTFRRGDLFRLSQVQESQRRLYNLQTFQFANIEPEVPEGEQPAVVPVKVTVAEGKHQKVNFGLGYGSEENARASIDWRHVNFLGAARTMEIESKYSSLTRGVRANFRQPYLFGPRLDLLASAQSWHNSEPAFTQNTNGGRLTVERVLARAGPASQRSASTTISLTYTREFESYRVSELALNTPTFYKNLLALGLDPLTGEGRGTLSSLDLDFHRSTADSTVNAQHGYSLTAHVEQAGRLLGGDFDFLETILEGRYYLPLGGRALVAVKARGGSIGTLLGDTNLKVPFFRRYFLGGATSLRGWGRFEVSPLYAGLPIGGHTMVDSSVEVRAPLWGNLTGVLFADAGNVWNNAWDFNLNDLRYDVGPGLRYATPIGPLRVDLGYQLNPIPGLLINGKPEPRRFRIHFSIGQAF
ncbi:MAG TPA: BamA/TamA family outer membrane protein [Vicinamibacterales bacterium]|nr:BamA/TamA family outer membrane protein [Vicinamibacterales bacterium]